MQTFEEFDSIFEHLQRAEHELRKNGNHVLHDLSQELLWVFDLSGPDIRRDPARDEKISQILIRYSLKRVYISMLYNHTTLICP